MERRITEALLQDPRFRFVYLVPHPDQDPSRASPLHYYTSGILETAFLFPTIAQWPGDIRELSSDSTSVLIFRSLGLLDRRVSPIEFTALKELIQVSRPFTCVVSTDDTYEFVAETLRISSNVCLHISATAQGSAIGIGDVDASVLWEYARTALKTYQGIEGTTTFVRYASAILDLPVVEDLRTLDIPERLHGLTAANEVALKSFGFKFSRQEPLLPDKKDTYVDVAIESARATLDARRKLLSGRDLAPRNLLIVSVMSPAWIARKTELNLQQITNAQERAALSRIWRALRDQDMHYLDIDGSQRGMQRVLPSHDDFKAMGTMRAMDAAAYVAALAVHAAHDLTPVIRLEPRLNRIRPRLAQIGSCARGGGPHRDFKLRKLGALLMAEMESRVDRRYIDLLGAANQNIEGLSLVSDLPLELLPIQGLPLGMRFNCSRIPANPGSFSFGRLLQQRPTEISVKAASTVLVVRSFSQGDPLRGMLEYAVKGFSRRTKAEVDVSIVDVRTPQEFIDAVNAFRGALMVFDGHGTRDCDDETGAIVIGGEPMDLWAYRRELRLPPIVLLSACDTLPLDGSHGSTATAVLNAGARTVLGTTLPISGRKAAIFIGRLIFRLAEFLPLALRLQRNGVEWRGFLSGLLRMAHTSELLMEIVDQHNLKESVYSDIQLEANIHINNQDVDWANHTRSVAERVLPRSVVEALPLDGLWCQLSDALKYVQLGNPQNIFIRAD